MSCAFNLVTRAFSLITRGSELATRGFELVPRGFELVTRGLELVTRYCPTYRKMPSLFLSFFLPRSEKVVKNDGVLRLTL